MFACAFAVGVGSSGVCVFHALILMTVHSSLLNCEVLGASLVGSGAV